MSERNGKLDIDLRVRLHWRNLAFREDVVAFLGRLAPSVKVSTSDPRPPLSFRLEMHPGRRQVSLDDGGSVTVAVLDDARACFLAESLHRYQRRWPKLGPTYWAGDRQVVGNAEPGRLPLISNPQLWPTGHSPEDNAWREAVLDDFDYIFPEALYLIPVYIDSTKASLEDAGSEALALVAKSGGQPGRRERDRPRLERDLDVAEAFEAAMGNDEDSAWDAVIARIGKDIENVDEYLVRYCQRRLELRQTKELAGVALESALAAEFDAHDTTGGDYVTSDLLSAIVRRLSTAKQRLMKAADELGPAE